MTTLYKRECVAFEISTFFNFFQEYQQCDAWSTSKVLPDNFEQLYIKDCVLCRTKRQLLFKGKDKLKALLVPMDLYKMSRILKRVVVFR